MLSNDWARLKRTFIAAIPNKYGTKWITSKKVSTVIKLILEYTINNRLIVLI